MKTHAIRTKQALQSPEEVEQVAGPSKQVAADESLSELRSRGLRTRFETNDPLPIEPTTFTRSARNARRLTH